MGVSDSDSYAKLWQVAYRTAFRILRDHHEAEDIAQGALLVFWKKVNQGSEVMKRHAWVKATALRLALAQRRKTRKAVPVSEVPSLESHCDEEYLGTLDDLARLLTPRDRIMLQLRYVEDMTIRDIAHCLRIPPGTTKWRLHQIRKQIRQINHLR
jgi:RNA polymerase sigma factor (sigma-70 family)